MKRCNWPKMNTNQSYMDYHDNEWGIPSYDDHHLFEMFILESFHCGLSWLLILNKRDNFRKAFDNFDPEKIIKYDETKIEELLNNSGIVRNGAKIRATITNASSFLKVKKEFGSFSNYLWSFTNHQIKYTDGESAGNTNQLSDIVSKDLKKRGFKFMGSVTTLSYLQAVGIQNDHASYCFKYHKHQN